MNFQVSENQQFGFKSFTGGYDNNFKFPALTVSGGKKEEKERNFDCTT